MLVYLDLRCWQTWHVWFSQEEIAIEAKVLRAGKVVGVAVVELKKKSGKLIAQARYSKYLGAASSKLWSDWIKVALRRGSMLYSTTVVILMMMHCPLSIYSMVWCAWLMSMWPKTASFLSATRMVLFCCVLLLSVTLYWIISFLTQSVGPSASYYCVAEVIPSYSTFRQMAERGKFPSNH